ncbi:MAG: DNA helicase RecQ [Verrucomicrobiota bacterium]
MDLRQALKQHFGFATFRPLQEEIIRDSMAGRDVLALLPTGGGKSLCFQLPALVQPGLTIVVSPLIALMKDQVDALDQAGIPATFLNSSLSKADARERWRRLYQNEYRLLYVAPERLVLDGFLSEVPKWNVNRFAIDEAHCISEWGHDFRPEYRQLTRLRELMPKVPVMALTATATERVRKDILTQLHLENAVCYTASFNRPNLSYRVEPKQGAYEQVLAFIRRRPRESGIIYCQARKTTESLAQRLKDDGVSALPYHAGLTPEERSTHQERFIRDQTQVICATIAFGMGINKPNVRFVIHHDLPKNVESYYQETGRAGRDGLPSECLLLFSAGDVMKYKIFIDQKTDPQEQRIARQQLQHIANFAEISECRRVSLLDYFGEQYPDTNCGNCDNCLGTREKYDGTILAQKFLSCVFRIRQKSGFNAGLNHLVEVLTGADTEKIRRWEHHTLSTYGIGRETSRPEWQAIGRELIRLGYLAQSDESFATLSLTAEGLSLLKERKTVMLTRPPKKTEPPKARRAGEIECDEALFDILRELRRRMAEERGVPPYVIFSDVSLRHMARRYPQSQEEFAGIHGVGTHKLHEFGAAFLAEITFFIKSHSRQEFADPVEAAPVAMKRTAGITDTVADTLSRHRRGQSPAEIARQRGLVVNTVCGHLLDAIAAGEAVDLDQLFTPDQQAAMDLALKLCPGDFTAMIKYLGPEYTGGMIRLYRDGRRWLQRKGK